MGSPGKGRQGKRGTRDGMGGTGVRFAKCKIGRLGFQSDVAIVAPIGDPVAIKMEKSELRQRPDFMPLCQSSTSVSPAGDSPINQIIIIVICSICPSPI